MKIDALLIEQRNRLNLSQQAVADFVGVTQVTYHNWESGKTDIPFRKIKRLAEILKLEVSRILEVEEIKPIESANETTIQEKISFDSYETVFFLQRETILVQNLLIKKLNQEIEKLRQGKVLITLLLSNLYDFQSAFLFTLEG